MRRTASSAQVRQIVMTAPLNSMEIQFPVPERAFPFGREARLRASRLLPSVYNDVCRLWVAVIHSLARAFARLLARPTQLAIERGGVALQDHLRDLPDRRCPRPQAGGPMLSAPVLASAVAQSAHLAFWPQHVPSLFAGG